MKLMNLGIISCLALSACGEEKIADNNDVIPATHLVETMAEAQCDRLFDCCAEDELKLVLGGTDSIDKDTCVENLKQQFGAFFGPSVEEAQTKNRISVDISKIAACGEAIKTQSCENIADDSTQIQRFQACQNAVIAEQEPAGFCDHNYECKSGFCVSDEDGGSCKEVTEVGDACQSLSCFRGQYCGDDDTCLALKEDGEMCTADASCMSSKCSKETKKCEAIIGICND